MPTSRKGMGWSSTHSSAAKVARPSCWNVGRNAPTTTALVLGQQIAATTNARSTCRATSAKIQDTQGGLPVLACQDLPASSQKTAGPIMLLPVQVRRARFPPSSRKTARLTVPLATHVRLSLPCGRRPLHNATYHRSSSKATRKLSRHGKQPRPVQIVADLCALHNCQQLLHGKFLILPGLQQSLST